MAFEFRALYIVKHQDGSIAAHVELIDYVSGAQSTQPLHTDAFPALDKARSIQSVIDNLDVINALSANEEKLRDLQVNFDAKVLEGVEIIINEQLSDKNSDLGKAVEARAYQIIDDRLKEAATTQR